MNGGEFPEQSPAWAVGGKHQILVVISYIFRAGVRWPAAEIRVMNLQELFRHRGRRGNHDIDEAEAEVHQRAVDAGQRREGVVRHRAHVWQVAHYGPWFRARWEGEGWACYELYYTIYDDRCCKCSQGKLSMETWLILWLWFQTRF